MKGEYVKLASFSNDELKKEIFKYVVVKLRLCSIRFIVFTVNSGSSK